MNAIVIQHNFIEAHTTIDKVLCNRAGQELSLGENRWLGLIHFPLTHFKSLCYFPSEDNLVCVLLSIAGYNSLKSSLGSYFLSPS